MSIGSTKDAVEHRPSNVGEAPSIPAADFQTGGNRADMTVANQKLVESRTVSDLQITGATPRDTAAGPATPTDAGAARTDGPPKAADGPPKAAESPRAAEAPPKAGEAPRAAEAPPKAAESPRAAEAPPKAAESPRAAEAPPKAGEAPRAADAPPKAAESPRAAEAPPKPGEAPRAADAPPRAPEAPAPAPDTAGDIKATNPQFLENAKVRRGEGPYQVASRLLGADGQPTKQSDVKALTEAFKKVYGAEQAKDSSMPGLAGLKQNHSFVSPDNLKDVAKALTDAGHPELAARLTKDATQGAAKPGDQPAKPGDPPAKPGEIPPQKGQVNAEAFGNNVMEFLHRTPPGAPLDNAVDLVGQKINERLQDGNTFAPDTTKDSLTAELNKDIQSSQDPRLKGKEFAWDNNKLKLRDKPKPTRAAEPAAPVTIES